MTAERRVRQLNIGIGVVTAGRLTTATPSGREIPQVLVNFQVKPNGGDGWLRLLEFRPDKTTVMAYDYSMTREQWNIAPDNTFEMTIPG